jgi:hypothetical protein
MEELNAAEIVALFTATAKVVRKTTRITEKDLATLQGFRIQTKADVFRYKQFRAELSEEATLAKTQLAGKTFNAIDQVERALYFMEMGVWQPSAIHRLTIYYVDRWKHMIDALYASYVRNVAVIKRNAQTMGHKKKNRTRRKKAKHCKPGGKHL